MPRVTQPITMYCQLTYQQGRTFKFGLKYFFARGGDVLVKQLLLPVQNYMALNITPRIHEYDVTLEQGEDKS